VHLREFYSFALALQNLIVRNTSMNFRKTVENASSLLLKKWDDAVARCLRCVTAVHARVKNCLVASSANETELMTIRLRFDRGTTIRRPTLRLYRQRGLNK